MSGGYLCRTRRIFNGLMAGILLSGLTLSGAAFAETDEIVVSQQFGVGYLPLMVMRNQKLIEKHAKKAGLDDLQVNWRQFGGGSATNTALISGQLDFASGGVGPMLKIWDKTKGTRQEVKGVAAINAMPLFLNTRNPEVKSLKDFDSGDRIALPAVKVSIQAVVLQMAAAKEFGQNEFDKLDNLTVSAKHPDGMAQMLSGGSEINTHLTSPPFQYQELEEDGIRRVFSSYDVLGGKHTFNNVWTTSAFREENPKTYKAFYDALVESMDFINNNPEKAAQIYIEEASSKLSPDFILKLIKDPDIEFTVVPQRVTKFAEFMKQIGAMDNELKSWKDAFFEEVHGESGS